MYIVTYRYIVPTNMRKRYLALMRKTTKLYTKHGCLGYEVYEDAHHNGNWLEINRFRNKAHYQKVRAAVDADPQIEPLWQEFCAITRAKEKPPIQNEYELYV